jgi:hypothetical protein
MQETFPGAGSGSVAMKTVDGTEAIRTAGRLQGLCESQGLPNTQADCWPIGTTVFTGQTPGVTVTVAWVGSVTPGGVPVVSIGGFRVMCVYRSPANGGGGGGGNGNGNGNGGNGGNGGGGGETCEWLDGTANRGYFQARGVETPYSMGTIVGYPVPTYPGLGNGSQLGNAPSLGQRLILVR